MNIHELNEILDLRRKAAVDSGFSYNFSKHVDRCWNKYIEFLEFNNINHTDFSKKLFLEKMKKLVRKNDFYYYKHSMTIIDGIDKIDNYTNRQRIIIYEKDYLINDYNKNVLKLYGDSRSEYNKKRTLDEKKIILRDIMIFCSSNNINNFSKITIDEVVKIKNYCLSFEKYSVKRRFIWVLRDFLTFLYEEHYLNINYSIIIDKLQKETKKLPTTWSSDEIEKIVSTLPDKTPVEIRNKAMVLLTIRLGIRFIDIKNLKFENIEWKNNTINFIQRKTNVNLKLPLPEEVGNAIIKYIKEARPKTKEKYIFVTHDEYVKQISDNTSIERYLIDTYKKAGVDYQSKTNKGIHTFRHALATNMLKNRIPLSIISSTLGHLNQNSVKVYVSLDDNLLKECCLELEANYNE